jgi:DNA-directed RNA polymerase subunit K/omega
MSDSETEVLYGGEINEEDGDDIWGGESEEEFDIEEDEEVMYKDDDNDETDNDLFLTDDDDDDGEIEELFDMSADAEKADNITNEDDRITSDFICLEELTNLISTRVAHIEGGSGGWSTPLVNVERYDTPKDIAIRELKQKKLPLKLIRHVGNMIEIFDPNQMAYDINQLPEN